MTEKAARQWAGPQEGKGREDESVVVGFALEPALVGSADRATFGRGLGVDGESAFAAHPFRRFGLLEDLFVFQPLEQAHVACFVHLFDGGHEAEVVGYLRKSFVLSHFCEIGVEVAPFLALSCGGFRKIFLRVAYHPGGIACGDGDDASFEVAEEPAGVLEFLFGGFEENGGNLLVAFFEGFLREEGVAAAGLALAGKGGEEVLLCACSFYAFLFHDMRVL